MIDIAIQDDDDVTLEQFRKARMVKRAKKIEIFDDVCTDNFFDNSFLPFNQGDSTPPLPHAL